METVLGLAGRRPSRARKVILRSNGIVSRYYAIDPQTGKASHSNAQLTAEAVRLLGRQGCPLDTIDVLACGTTLPDQLMPNHGVMVHGELGLPPCEVAALSGICVSGIMALKYGFLSVRAGESRNVVATGSENVSSLLRGHNFSGEVEAAQETDARLPELAFSKDFLRWMLSDGAGAVWLGDQQNSEGSSLRIDWIVQKSYAGEMEPCMYAGAEKTGDGTLKGWRDFMPGQWLDESIFTIKQDVKLLNEKIIDYSVIRPLEEFVTAGLLNPANIDWFLPHYSSEFFRDKVAAGMRAAGCAIPQDRWFTNLPSKGNTGSASMYIILEELFHSGRLHRGESLLCYIPESGRFSTAFMHLTVV
jgi:3-oxoacyl-[acyl-carrier-protein] synthase-3